MTTVRVSTSTALLDALASADDIEVSGSLPAVSAGPPEPRSWRKLRTT